MPKKLEFAATLREAKGESVPFAFAGEDFTAVPPSGLALLEFAAASGLDTDSEDPAELSEASSAMFNFLKAIIKPSDWRRFRKVALENQVELDDLLEVITGLMPELVGRPTEPSSDSADTQSTGGRHLRDASTLPEPEASTG